MTGYLEARCANCGTAIHTTLDGTWTHVYGSPQCSNTLYAKADLYGRCVNCKTMTYAVGDEIVHTYGSRECTIHLYATPKI